MLLTNCIGFVKKRENVNMDISMLNYFKKKHPYIQICKRFVDWWKFPKQREREREENRSLVPSPNITVML